MVYIYFLALTGLIYVLTCGIDDKNTGTIQFINTESQKQKRVLDSSSISTNSTGTSNFSSSNVKYLPIRIAIDYSTLLNDKVAKNLDILAFQNALSYSSSMMTKLTNVIPLSKNLSITQCNNNTSINSTIASTGIKADLILFPYIDYSNNTSLQSFSIICAQDATSGRPLAGVIGLVYNSVNWFRPNWQDYYTKQLLHELTHLMVFNPNLFPYFLNPITGIAYSSVNRTALINGILRNVIVTPLVVKVVRSHYNCSTAIGAELENNDTILGAHWEARTMLGDYMTAQTNYQEVMISDITIALFEDSGWYKMNYFTGGLFRRGKNEGCDFLYTPCINSSYQVSFPNDFCSIKNMNVCSSSRTSKGTCYFTQDQNIISKFQYWGNNTNAGLLLADDCPVSMTPSNNSPYYYSTNCLKGDKSLQNTKLFEYIGNSSSCFYASNNSSAPTSVCYKVGCNSLSQNYNVTIGTNLVICSTQNGEVSANSNGITIECPPYWMMCPSSQPCNDIFDCINKNSTGSTNLVNSSN